MQTYEVKHKLKQAAEPKRKRQIAIQKGGLRADMANASLNGKKLAKTGKRKLKKIERKLYWHNSS